jgi:hypothetical protein
MMPETELAERPPGSLNLRRVLIIDHPHAPTVPLI